MLLAPWQEMLAAGTGTAAAAAQVNGERQLELAQGSDQEAAGRLLLLHLLQTGEPWQPGALVTLAQAAARAAPATAAAGACVHALQVAAGLHATAPSTLTRPPPPAVPLRLLAAGADALADRKSVV